MTTVTQGTVGLGKAISYFTSLSNTVLLPLNDNQDYDLVVDSNGLKKVQVKTTKYQENGKFVVQLKTVRSNKTKNKIQPFDNTLVDFVFIHCIDGSNYNIPSSDIIAKHALTLTERLSKYKV